MFEARLQSFQERASRAETPQRIAQLRAELARRGLGGGIVPRADRYQNEYVPASDERLAWLTGFSGSAGLAIVLIDRAALFVDGRYQLQARAEVDANLFAIEHSAQIPPEAWIEKNVPAATKLGYDPWLHTSEAVEKFAKACAAAGATLVPLESNPVDAVWSDRPRPPLGAVSLHDIRFAGEETASKLARIVTEIESLRADALVVTDPHAVAWTFNMRGSDVAHTPIALANAVIPRQGRAAIYIDARKLSNAVRAEIERHAEARDPERLLPDLAALAAGKTIRLDPATAPDALSKAIEGAGGKAARGPDPVAAMKAVKNAAEIAGARAAHKRDGAALARFLSWFAREAPQGRLSEIDAVAALETFRRETGELKDISFPTIAGAGADGAIVHYRVTERSNRPIAKGELFLIDSGAQYADGTTDVTRTLAVGAPSAEMRDRFTRVLKGHIAIATAVFPDGATGAQLDSLARLSLWQAGLDFDHGTGHGVGSYLSVHEGPARISKLGTTALKRGMILSNEPGYYKAGVFGIRIENLVLVIEGPQLVGAERALNAFETLTLAPIDRALIAPELMTADEIAWLDRYHARVAHELAPLLDSETRSWLESACRPIASAR